jgi:hypothetical protein
VGFIHRVGNFFLLAGIIGLLVFAATLLVPTSDCTFTVTAFLVGALLFGFGLKLRMTKLSGPPRGAASGEAHSAAKSGPPHAGAKPGAPKQGLLSAIVKGPADRKKTAPAPPKPPAGALGGGRPPAGKGGGGGQRKK